MKITELNFFANGRFWLGGLIGLITDNDRRAQKGPDGPQQSVSLSLFHCRKSSVKYELSHHFQEAESPSFFAFEKKRKNAQIEHGDNH